MLFIDKYTNSNNLRQSSSPIFHNHKKTSPFLHTNPPRIAYITQKTRPGNRLAGPYFEEDFSYIKNDLFDNLSYRLSYRPFEGDLQQFLRLYGKLHR